MCGDRVRSPSTSPWRHPGRSGETADRRSRGKRGPQPGQTSSSGPLMTLIGSIRAEVIRQRHTRLSVVLIGFALGGVLIFLGYYSFVTYDPWSEVTVYLELVGGVIPLVVGLVCGFVAERELQAGGYAALLSLPSRRLALAGVMIQMEMLYVLVALVSVGPFALGMALWGQNPLSMGLWLQVLLGLILGGAALIPLTMVIALAWGRQFGILTGVLGSLLGYLLQTGLGDRIWWFLPPALPSHLSAGVPALADAGRLAQGAMDGYRTVQGLGWVMSIVLALLSWVLAMVWVAAFQPGRGRR